MLIKAVAFYQLWHSFRSSSLFQRKRDFEREREADSKDRLREQQEIDELRKQILAENKDVQDVDEEARRRHFEKAWSLLAPWKCKFSNGNI